MNNLREASEVAVRIRDAGQVVLVVVVVVLRQVLSRVGDRSQSVSIVVNIRRLPFCFLFFS
jgi:hypothetical protein